MRLNNHVNHMATLGDPVATVQVVKKFLACVPEKYMQIAMSIETLLDLKTMFFGYEAGSTAYRCFNPVSKKVVVSRGVVFDETARWD